MKSNRSSMTMNNTYQDVIYLASCAINNRIPEKERVEAMNLDDVYEFASRHMIAAAVAFVLESAGYKDSYSKLAIGKSMRRTALFDKEWNLIRDIFEKEHIWYMPLKGAVLKSYYPKYGMREFSDYDILIDASRAADVRFIMEEQGFKTTKFDNGNHDIYYKKPVLIFEMHRSLFDLKLDRKLYEYYRNVEERLLSGNTYEMQFSAEDFYLFLLTHEYKHYSDKGTGLRSLLDTYIYLKTVPLDMDYVEEEVKKLGIEDFERDNRSLSLHLFGDETLTESDLEMLDYIISSGVYGIKKHKVQNQIKEKGWSKPQYALHRFLVPISSKNPEYEGYAKAYPLFYRHKLLLPLLPFYRIFFAIKKGRFEEEAKALKEVFAKK